MSKFIYGVDPWILKNNPRLATQINGVTVSLTGKPFDAEYPADQNGPARTVTIPAATQEQMKALYEQGNNPIYIRTEVADTPNTAKAVEPK